MADITVTIPNSTFTIDTISNGIEVTTPTNVEVNVDTNSNTIDIVNTPQQITVLTAGTLNITSGDDEYLATLTTSTTAANQVVDSFSAAVFRTAKYLASISSASSYQAVEILVTHDGTTAVQAIYGDLPTASNLAAFTVDINAGLVRLLTTPVNAVTAYKVIRTAIAV
jgi:hypothetical protein